VTFKVQQQELAPFVMSPLHKQYYFSFAVGASHGLLCMSGFHGCYNKRMLVIWNPAIGKSFGIAAPIIGFSQTRYGFWVCPVTKDPTVVKIVQKHNKPWHAEVFTLSSRVWNVIPSTNLPHESIILDQKTHVAIHKFIYWGASEETIYDDGEGTINPMVVSFDLITKEFKVVDLPNSLTNELTYGFVSVSKLRESLVVYGSINVDGAECCGVWVMECDSSFRKLFSISSPLFKILGFSKNGEPLFEIQRVGGRCTTLNVYDPSSQQIKNLVILGGEDGSSFLGSYTESLLLLDHSDSRIY
nr:hypothetical protein [Tanacetum cinerariifolium]